MKNDEKTSFFTSFYRSQFASIIATAADFLVTIFFTEIFKIWYVLSTALGNLTGAVISFFLGRNWAFNQKEGALHWQAVRYTITSLVSMGLNTGGVYLLTENFDISYVISKAIVAILIGVSFNFLMFRYFVFK
ncbi:MAG: putative flippase GtrA [Paraglaciecola sp.]|jgi:putative flippase GtrA